MNQETSRPIYINNERCLQMPLITFYLFASDRFKNHILHKWVKRATEGELREHRLPLGCQKINFGHDDETLIPIHEIFQDTLTYVQTLEMEGCRLIHYLINERFHNSEKDHLHQQLVLSKRILPVF